MKKLNKNLIFPVLIFALVLGFVGPTAALAATTPSLGAAATYGVLSNTYTNTVAGTTINGSVGFTTGPAVLPAGVHANYGPGAPYATAGTDQGNALSALALEPCTFTFAPGAINLSTDITHGPIGVYTPGVYCSTGAMDIGGALTLSGSGTFIFRPVGALTSTAGSVITLTGASACDIFWTPTQATTLAANTIFSGIVIDNAGITIGANTTWSGMALAFGGTVTTDTNTITVPTCAVLPVASSSRQGTINVVKTVINDNGGTKTIADFPLFVNGTLVLSGVTNVFRAPNDLFSITETSDAKYTRTFSGDCDVNGQLNLSPGDNKFCIITNNDIGAPVIAPPIPPLIDVVKVPSPLALPAGPGLVNYTYTLSNIGTVPVTNITMTGDTCSPIVLASGDTNSDAKLDLNEKWVYKCSTTLLETHTNTVVTTGWANGLSATDIASATVVVGMSVLPPLIHVTKIPYPLTLVAGGGMVTYTEKISNPGLVALSNVQLSDDKCSPVNYNFGDTNNDLKLDTTETWTYTCQSNLTKTTTNIAVASGQANGLTVRDFAIATVVVAVPALPKAGLAPENRMAWENILVLAGLLMLTSGVFALAYKKLRI